MNFNNRRVVVGEPTRVSKRMRSSTPKYHRERAIEQGENKISKMGRTTKGNSMDNRYT
jgi:hypothetical protein